jgi:uncharacterized Tic20 family protein
MVIKKVQAKKKVFKTIANKEKSKKIPSLDQQTKYDLNHANLYYIMMVVSLVLGLFFLVQAIIFHVNGDQIQWPLTHYTMFVLLMIVAKSSHNRGKGHYHYHGHIKS